MQETTNTTNNDINFSDQNVISLFNSLDQLKIKDGILDGTKVGTLGIPECSTNFTLQMLHDIKPSRFDHLIRFSGLSHGTGV
jgi:DNA polymerase-3 subunit alpha (Gram-positive type)